jgi:AcrR family transcriptional regulator
MQQVFQRARRPEQRDDRRQDIINTALSVLDHVPFAELTMAALAEKAGLAKGTLYLYFPTKEQLLLVLVEELTVRWLEELKQSLSLLEGTSSDEHLAEAVSRCMLRQPTFIQLLPVACAIIEQHEDEPWAADYRRRNQDRARQAGTAVEKCLSAPRPGTGARFLVYAVALVTGLQQLKRKKPSSPKDGESLFQPDPFETSLEEELPISLCVVLRGLHQPAL